MYTIPNVLKCGRNCLRIGPRNFYSLCGIGKRKRELKTGLRLRRILTLLVVLFLMNGNNCCFVSSQEKEEKERKERKRKRNEIAVVFEYHQCYQDCVKLMLTLSRKNKLSKCERC